MAHSLHHLSCNHWSGITTVFVIRNYVENITTKLTGNSPAAGVPTLGRRPLVKLQTVIRNLFAGEQ